MLSPTIKSKSPSLPRSPRSGVDVPDKSTLGMSSKKENDPSPLFTKILRNPFAFPTNASGNESEFKYPNTMDKSVPKSAPKNSVVSS